MQKELEKLQNELEKLETEYAAEVEEGSEEAGNLGDPPENAAPDKAKAEEGNLETRIAKVEKMLEEAGDLGDLPENAAPDKAEEEQGNLGARIAKAEEIAFLIIRKIYSSIDNSFISCYTMSNIDMSILDISRQNRKPI